MTRHYNPSIVERANRVLASKAGDFLSDEVAGPVATIAITPVTRIIKASGSSTTGTMTIFTTPTDKDFYITGLYLSMIKDVTNDMATGNVAIALTIDGVTVNPIGIGVLTLTAQSESVAFPFTTPIKVDRGTAITIGATYTAGSMRRFGSVHGYTEEVTR